MQHTWPDGVLYNSTIHDHAAHAVLSIGNFPGDFPAHHACLVSFACAETYACSSLTRVLIHRHHNTISTTCRIVEGVLKTGIAYTCS